MEVMARTFLWPCQGNWVRVLVTDEMPWALLCNEIVTQALVLKDLTVPFEARGRKCFVNHLHISQCILWLVDQVTLFPQPGMILYPRTK